MNHSADLPDDLVPLARAATTLHVNRATVYRWATSGRLRCWRLAGHRYMVSLADVRELMQPVRVREVSAGAERSRRKEARAARTQEVLRRHGLA